MAGLSQKEMIAFIESWVSDNKKDLAEDLSKQLSPFITNENLHCLELIMTMANRLLLNWVPLLMIQLLEENNQALESKK